MSLHTLPFREQSPPCPAVRDENRANLRRLEAAKLAFTAAAHAYADELSAIGFLSRWEISTRRNTMTSDEAIVGFIERADDIAQDIVDLDATEDAARLADGRLIG